MNSVDTSISNSDYLELPFNSLGTNINLEGRAPAQSSKLSGSVHRGAKVEQPKRKVTFDMEKRVQRPAHPTPVEGTNSPNPVSFPPEIELSSTQSHEEVDVSPTSSEEKESLARLQLLIRLGFEAYFCRDTSSHVLRHFWIHEELDDGHILLWVDCERMALCGAVPLYDIMQLEREEKMGLAINTKSGTLNILFLSTRERDFWMYKLDLLKDLYKS